MPTTKNNEYFSCVEDLGRLLMAKTAGKLSDDEFEKLATAGILKGLNQVFGGMKTVGTEAKKWMLSKKNPLHNAVGFAKAHPWQAGSLGAGAYALGSMSAGDPRTQQPGYGARYH
mgnify:CR=1 FL=1